MFRVQQAVENKILAKKKEKFSANSELIQHAQSREFLHLPVTIQELPSERRGSLSSTDSAAFKSASAGSCETDDFVIRRRSSVSAKSLKVELAKINDNTSSSSVEYLKVSGGGYLV